MEIYPGAACKKSGANGSVLKKNLKFLAFLSQVQVEENWLLISHGDFYLFLNKFLINNHLTKTLNSKCVDICKNLKTLGKD